jgi:3-hydroxyacyl-[acyl-carrier-protein] dehydratase
MGKTPIAMHATEHLIPQRAPFVMVDRITDFGPHHVETAFVVLPGNLLAANGVLGEAGVVEHMAQSVAAHTGYAFYLRNEPAPTGYIGVISDMVVERLPAVGDTLCTRVDILHEFNGVTMVKIATTANGIAIASGGMKTVIAQPLQQA